MTIPFVPPGKDLPHPETADEDGLVAFGGELTASFLIKAYSCGMFPWYSEGQPLLWWSPDPRLVLFPENFHESAKLKRRRSSSGLECRINTVFSEVIRYCSRVPRPGQNGTWITEDMIQAYSELNRLGHAHSFEVFEHGVLTGGLYGVSLGKAFFGESMFHLKTDASKIALACLVNYMKKNDGLFIDCQVDTPHLRSLGARLVSRQEFLGFLKKADLSEGAV